MEKYGLRSRWLCLEPGTDYPNAKSFERQQGRLVHLEPGETHRVELAVEVLDSDGQVAAVQGEIDALQQGVERVVHVDPIGRYSDLGEG